MRTSISSQSPMVSIGVPVYNGEKFLATALDSLLAQSYSNLEILISDNCSTDQTQSICRSYASRDSRIRYFRQDKNRGAAWNFGHVYGLSRGRYFKWAAADDICAPTFVARCVEVLEQDPSVVCCHSRMRKIDHAGRPLEHLSDPTTTTSMLLNRPMDASSRYIWRRFLDVLLTHGWGARSYGVFRSNALRDSQLIQPTYGFEKVLLAELSLIGRFHDVPETLWFQRVHESASSALPTAAARHQFVIGNSTPTVGSPRFNLLRGHLHSLGRHKLSLATRTLCLFAIARYLLQVNKWSRVLGEFQLPRGATITTEAHN